MIINISRGKQFQQCRQKAYNWDELRLVPSRDAEPLLTGASYHAGVAVGFATGDWNAAVVETEKVYRKAIEGKVVLAEEKQMFEREIFIACEAVRQYSKHYISSDFTVLQPEVAFCIPLPNTLHHDWFSHRILFPFEDYDSCCIGYHFLDRHNEAGKTERVVKCPCGEEWTYENLVDRNWQCTCGKYIPRCIVPHYFKGRSDALISWNRMLWILEHKTAAQSQQYWWDKFILDIQLTGYLYGVWKSIGTMPNGVLVNKILKPRKNAADPRNIGFEREPYLRTEEDLVRFERQISAIADDYELAFRDPQHRIYMNTDSCLAYNRRCYYFDRCNRHNENREGEFAVRTPDYVEETYYEILGLPKPAGFSPAAEEPENGD
jgi:hypothetical protein